MTMIFTCSLRSHFPNGKVSNVIKSDFATQNLKLIGYKEMIK